MNIINKQPLISHFSPSRKFICFSQDERLETEGTPVPVSRLERGLHYTHGVYTYVCTLSFHCCVHTLQRPIPECSSTTARQTTTWQYTKSGLTSTLKKLAVVLQSGFLVAIKDVSGN